ncbi:MAG TPA: hypothetical protein VIC86_09525 [Acidimicrobiales bacterium]
MIGADGLPGRPGSRRAFRALAALASVALLSGLVSACSTPAANPSPAGDGGSGAPVPLASAFAGPSAAWVALAMGHVDDPRNTFWQLFSISNATGGWELATPPGVASNGGIVGSVSPSGSVAAGFAPALGLRFSPLAQSDDGGATWVPGVLPGGLAPVPDSLAISSAHRYAALIGSGAGGEVLASSGDLSIWKALALTRSLAADRPLAGCGIQALSAVAVTPAGVPVVGAACARGGRAGIFTERNGGWQWIGPSLPASVPGPTQVIRLTATPDGATALVRAGVGPSSRLFGARSTDGLATWSVSPPVPGTGRALVSTGVTTAGALIAVTQLGPSRSAAVLDGGGGAWLQLAPLPAGTVAVAALPGGSSYDALIVRQSTLDVDALGESGWRHVQSVDVPIQYGSSG